MPEAEQRRALLVPVAPVLVLGLVRGRVRVDQRHLPDRPRPREGQPPGRRDVAEQEVGDRGAALGPRVPDVEDRRHVLRRPAQVERTAVHHQQHDRRAGRRRRPAAARAAVPAAPARTVRPPRRSCSATRRRRPPRRPPHGRPRPRARAPARRRSRRGPPARCRRTCRTSTGRSAARGGCRARNRTRRGLCSDAGEERHGLVEVVVEAPRAQRVAPRVRERAEHGDRCCRRRSGRSDALVAQQHRRALGGDARHFAVGRIGEHLPRALLVDVGLVEQADAQLGLEHAPHAGVEELLVDGPGQTARRPGRRSPSPCRSPPSRPVPRHRAGPARSRG